MDGTRYDREAEYKRVFGNDETEQEADDIEFNNAFDLAACLIDIKRKETEIRSVRALSPLDIESRDRQLQNLEEQRKAAINASEQSIEPRASETAASDDPFLKGPAIIKFFVSLTDKKKASYQTVVRWVNLAGLAGKILRDDPANKYSSPKIRRSVIRDAVSYHAKKK